MIQLPAKTQTLIN